MDRGALWHDDVSGHSELAKSIQTPIALGEMLYSLAHFREFISSGGVRFVQPDGLGWVVLLKRLMFAT